MTAERICVYTALFGNYEGLNPQPLARESDTDWICFTDDSSLTSDDWDVVVVEPTFVLDPHRSSRRVKMLGHPLVRECAASLWIDNSVVLEADPRMITSTMLHESDIAFVSHSYRSSVLDEFFVVLDDRLDDPDRIVEQLEHYMRTRPHVLDERPLWGGMIARRWSPAVDEAMRVWWDHLLRYSRRDQLSLVYALDSVGLVPHRVEIDNFESTWHRWPVAPERKGTMRQQASDPALRRPLVRAIELEREVARLREEPDVLRSEIASLRNELEVSRELEAEHERARNEAELRLVHVTDVELPAVTAELDRHRELLADAQRRLEAVVDDRIRRDRANTEAHNELSARLTAVTVERNAIVSSRSWRFAQRISRWVHVVVDPLRRR